MGILIGVSKVLRKREEEFLLNLTEYKELCPLAAWTLLKRDAELRELPRNDRIVGRARTEM